MTVAPAVSCGVCATPLEASARRCPSCGSPASTASATPPSPLPTLLAGCVRASTTQRALAVGTDVLVLVALGAVALLDPDLLGDLAWLPVVLYLLLTVAGLALSGRTLGHLAAGLRTVDLFTGLPLGLGRLLTAWRADGVPLVVRGARDPLRTTSSARPGSPAARAAQPGVAASWGPAPGSAVAPPEPAGADPAARSRRAQRAAAPAAPAPRAAPAPAQPWGAPGAGTAALGAAAAAPPPPTGSAPTAPAPSAAPSSTSVPGRTTGSGQGVVVATADGGRFTVTGTALLGRNPQPRDGEQVGASVPINDLQRSVSKTHAGLRWDGRSLWLTDRGSTNGTVVVGPSGHAQQLRPWEELAVQPGSTIQLGDQTVTVSFPGEGVPR